MSRVRIEECDRKIIFMPNKNFLKKYKKGPKIHCFALKMYTGASKSGGQGGPASPPPPGYASACPEHTVSADSRDLISRNAHTFATESEFPMHLPYIYYLFSKKIKMEKVCV